MSTLITSVNLSKSKRSSKEKGKLSDEEHCTDSADEEPSAYGADDNSESKSDQQEETETAIKTAGRKDAKTAKQHTRQLHAIVKVTGRD